MSKRFTDISKWLSNKWFFTLSPTEKLFWIFLCENCSSIGIWEENIKLAGILIGYDYDANIMDVFSERVIKIDESKYLIPDFISFQYGSLSRESRPHQSYIKEIEKQGLSKFFSDIIIDESNTIPAKRKRLTQNKKDEIIARDQFTCQYCGKQDKKEFLVIDHIIPLIKNGTNEDENLITSCINCNSLKSDLDLKTFIERNNLKDKLLDRVSKKLNTLNKRVQTLKEQEKVKDKVIDKDKEIFNEVRKLFPGTKRGNNTEFDNFTKHKNWKEILPLLLPAIEEQIKYRQNVPDKTFVPEWKNFKTWIYQRCWEEEIPRKVEKEDVLKVVKENLKKEKREQEESKKVKL